MTPKEKAKELVESFAETIPHKTFGVLMERDWATAKQCALIAVEELIKEYDTPMTNYMLLEKLSFWQQVKEEINNL